MNPDGFPKAWNKLPFAVLVLVLVFLADLGDLGFSELRFPDLSVDRLAEFATGQRLFQSGVVHLDLEHQRIFLEKIFLGYFQTGRLLRLPKN